MSKISYLAAVASEADRLAIKDSLAGQEPLDHLLTAFGLVDPEDHGLLTLSDEPDDLEVAAVHALLAAGGL